MKSADGGTKALAEVGNAELGQYFDELVGIKSKPSARVQIASFEC